MKPLSDKARAARQPQPPEELFGALQDSVHTDVGKSRPARTARESKRMKRKWPVNIELSGTDCVVSDGVVYRYGIGDTPKAAVSDYCDGLMWYFAELDKFENLSSRLQEHLKLLRNMFGDVVGLRKLTNEWTKAEIE